MKGKQVAGLFSSFLSFHLVFVAANSVSFFAFASSLSCRRSANAVSFLVFSSSLRLKYSLNSADTHTDGIGSFGGPATSFCGGQNMQFLKGVGNSGGMLSVGPNFVGVSTICSATSSSKLSAGSYFVCVSTLCSATSSSKLSSGETGLVAPIFIPIPDGPALPSVES